jgi:predicted CxxxxCH...CXXCH cytochrome family protein
VLRLVALAATAMLAFGGAASMAERSVVTAYGNFPASTCSNGSCHSIGASQRKLWAQAALAVPSVISTMNDLNVQRYELAPIDVFTLDATNSLVQVSIHLESNQGETSTVDSSASVLTVGFDNSMDHSTATNGVRLGVLRNSKYGPPRAITVSTDVVVLPTADRDGFIRSVAHYLGHTGTIPDDWQKWYEHDQEVPVSALGAGSGDVRESATGGSAQRAMLRARVAAAVAALAAQRFYYWPLQVVWKLVTGPNAPTDITAEDFAALATDHAAAVAHLQELEQAVQRAQWELRYVGVRPMR